MVRMLGDGIQRIQDSKTLTADEVQGFYNFENLFWCSMKAMRLGKFHDFEK